MTLVHSPSKPQDPPSPPSFLLPSPPHPITIPEEASSQHSLRRWRSPQLRHGHRSWHYPAAGTEIGTILAPAMALSRARQRAGAPPLIRTSSSPLIWLPLLIRFFQCESYGLWDCPGAPREHVISIALHCEFGPKYAVLPHYLLIMLCGNVRPDSFTYLFVCVCVYLASG